jgi:hypothetical protein
VDGWRLGETAEAAQSLLTLLCDEKGTPVLSRGNGLSGGVV